MAETAGLVTTPWRELHKHGWEKHQLRYENLERAALSILSYECSVIHGLFQTPAYARKVLADLVGVPADQLNTAVSSRTQRQELLHQPGTQWRVVLTEAVLRHRLAEPAVMVEQLQHIATLAALPTVDLGVIPIDTDMCAAYDVSFTLLELPDQTMALVELPTMEVVEGLPDKVATYKQAWNTYWKAAITGDAAIDFVRRVAQTHDRS